MNSTSLTVANKQHNTEHYVNNTEFIDITKKTINNKKDSAIDIK